MGLCRFDRGLPAPGKASHRALPSALQTHVMWWRGYNGVGERHAGLTAFGRARG